MLDRHRVSLVIPCLNEAAGLSKMLPQIPQWVDEVVVIDNGSTDETPTVASASAARVVRETRRGYGWACARGLQEASGDLVVKLDGDCTYPIEAIQPMLQRLLEHQLDFVSGSRFPLQDPSAMPWLSHIGNRVLTWLANWWFGLALQDSLSGMWAIRRTAISGLKLTQGGIPFSQEIKIEAFGLRALRAQEIPVGYYCRVGTSKLKPLNDGWACLRFLVWKRLNSLRQCPADRPVSPSY